MKIALFGVTGIKTGKHNLKDPRFDEADKLVEADKKTYAQVDVVGEDQLLDADAILVSVEGRADMILKDLEFVETRLGRDPQPAERAALKKSRRCSNRRNSFSIPAWRRRICRPSPRTIFSPPSRLWWRNRRTGKPRRAAAARVSEAGYICFLTVGGKENRAWPIRKGITAWEAGGTIHTDIQKGFIRAEIISYRGFHRGGRRNAGQARQQNAAGDEAIRHAGLRPDQFPVQQISGFDFPLLSPRRVV